MSATVMNTSSRRTFLRVVSLEFKRLESFKRKQLLISLSISLFTTGEVLCFTPDSFDFFSEHRVVYRQKCLTKLIPITMCLCLLLMRLRAYLYADL